MRLHPYYTQRVLARPGGLARIGELGAMAHERLDGSGYFRGLSGSAIGLPARVLAAANAFRSLQETRSHREAFSQKSAATVLLGEARDGRLDADAVDAVLDAAGQPKTRRPHGVADLTAREAEVLVLLAGGASNRQIAARLGHGAEDRREPHRAHLRQDRGAQPCRGDVFRHAARRAADAAGPGAGGQSMRRSPHDDDRPGFVRWSQPIEED